MVVAGCKPKSNPNFNVLAEMESTAEAITWGLSYLSSMRTLVKNPCVVLDIDGTILKNYEPQIGSNRPVAKCVNCFQTLVEGCIRGKISLFVVTARPDYQSNREWTMRQLDGCGIKPVVETFMRPEGYDNGTFKLKCRQTIRKNGYTILLSIGDQFLDLSKTRSVSQLDDYAVWAGTIGDDGSYAIKLPSEFPKEDTPRGSAYNRQSPDEED
jgi:hypothetical protein